MNKDKEVNAKEQFIKMKEINERIVENSEHCHCKERHHKKYEREFLLKIRMHPLALIKPKELPNISIIKNKAHFQSISDDLNRGNSQHSSSRTSSSGWLPSIIRSDGFRNMLSHSQAPSSYFNRGYPYHIASRLKKAMRSSSPPFSEYRSSLSSSSHISQLPRGFRYPATSVENIWNCYRGYSPGHDQPKKDSVITVPRNKKKLEIIDPETGKNILETVSAKQETSSVVSEAATSTEQDSDNTSLETDNCNENHCCVMQPDDLKTISMRKLGNGDANESTITHLSYEEDSWETLQELSNDSSSLSRSLSPSGDEAKAQLSMSCNWSKGEKYLEDTQQVNDNICEMHSAISPTEDMRKLTIEQKKDLKELHNTTDPEATPSPSGSSEADQNNNTDYVKQLERDTQLLRDNIYVLKKEQQQMGILKSFLLGKQQQLEETACLLEEKKIEMADLEFFLLSKERQLRRREFMIGSREGVLATIERKLEEREQQLCMMKACLDLNLNRHDKTELCKANRWEENVDVKNQETGDYLEVPREGESDGPSFSASLRQEISKFKSVSAHPKSNSNGKEYGNELFESGDGAYPKLTSAGRKYLPIDIQVWLEQKEKMMQRGEECDSKSQSLPVRSKDSKFVDQELSIQGGAKSSAKLDMFAIKT